MLSNELNNDKIESLLNYLKLLIELKKTDYKVFEEIQKTIKEIEKELFN